ncbi:hypothetical protein D068_cds41270 [Bacillus atrophaeus UCMB-5137]|nr:hypothetical protein D068_cds41270 [Bacillus atrophaeus UCMB-5137]
MTERLFHFITKSFQHNNLKRFPFIFSGYGLIIYYFENTQKG